MSDEKNQLDLGPFAKYVRFQYKYLVHVTADNVHEVAKFAKGSVDYSGKEPIIRWTSGSGCYSAVRGNVLEFEVRPDGRTFVTNYRAAEAVGPEARAWWPADNATMFKSRAKEKYLDQFNSHWG